MDSGIFTHPGVLYMIGSIRAGCGVTTGGRGNEARVLQWRLS